MSSTDPAVLLVVLGHTNLANGDLSDSSKLRCETAVDVIKKQSVNHVLATGAFGNNFNTSDVPHGILLIEAIKDLLGPSKISFRSSTSAFTEEDIFFARRYAVDLSAEKIIFVTSAFHLPRVKEMAKLILRDRLVEFVVAPNGEDISPDTINGEKSRIESFVRGWVDVPLYSTKNQDFPKDVYQNAREEHKHNDAISLSIVTGAFLVSAFPSIRQISCNAANVTTVQLDIVCSVMGYFLFCLYHRYVIFAFSGRRVMRGIELSWGTSGPSYNLDRFGSTKWSLYKRLGTVSTLRIIIATLIAINFYNVLCYFLFQY